MRLRHRYRVLWRNTSIVRRGARGERDELVRVDRSSAIGPLGVWLGCPCIYMGAWPTTEAWLVRSVCCAIDRSPVRIRCIRDSEPKS
jgi:hypothetical protein